MSERARQVYALLRTLHTWTPDPRSSTDSWHQPGFASVGPRGGNLRFLTCPDCLANDHPQGIVGCETCGGSGEIPDPGPDPYRIKATGFYASELDQRDERTRRDHVLDQLEEDAAVRDGQIAPSDKLTRALGAAERQARAGSYTELQRALQRLRDVNEAAYCLCMYVAYAAFGPTPIEPVRRTTIAACELIATWMPERIRVPTGVHVYTRDELEHQAAILRERAQWRGRKDPLARARRDEAIRRFHADGLAPAAIAERIGVHRRTVERTLNSDGS